MRKFELYHGDCLEVMKQLPDKSVDMILCDLPYGVTHNKWDSVIPFDLLWNQYERIITDNGVIALFAQDKFTAKLMLSNEKLHKYNLIWNKEIGGGFLNANKMPLRIHEDICIFYKKLPVYNPQMVQTDKPNHSRGSKNLNKSNDKQSNYDKFNIIESKSDGLKYPTSIISCKRVAPTEHQHPTQKPVELLEYLIKTYTNEKMTVLDNCMGSGTTGVACGKLNRRFIGIEKDDFYYEIADSRIRESYKDTIEYKEEVKSKKSFEFGL